jgi:hypothetical protein
LTASFAALAQELIRE